MKSYLAHLAVFSNRNQIQWSHKEILDMAMKNKSVTTKVDVARISKNIHGVELIFMVEKMYFGKLCGIDCSKK